MHDNLFHRSIVGKGAVADESDSWVNVDGLQSVVAVAESFALDASNVLGESIEIGIGEFETIQECTLTYGFQVVKVLACKDSCQILVVGECVHLYLCYLGSIGKSDVLQVAVLKRHLVDYRHVGRNGEVGKFETAEEDTVA